MIYISKTIPKISMILSRTPLRVSLGGGGTDLPFYADKYGGSLVTAAINKYVYITASPRMQKNIKLNYSKTEIVDKVEDINHPLIREALKLLSIKHSIEIHSTAEIPSGTGLGSSGAFTVGLLNGLNYYLGRMVSRYKLAEDSSHIIMDVLKEPCGKQDQYVSAFGGINHLAISTKGKVTVTPINITQESITQLETNLMMFYTGFTRSANELLTNQKEQADHDGKNIIRHYHRIKRIGDESIDCLERGDLEAFGSLMNTHWEMKRGISSIMSNDDIDKWYSLAIKKGALGGKIIGAGGGGFLIVYVEKNHKAVRKALEKEGLTYTPFKFDFDGSRIVYDGNHF
jgi:D-glycero-alpha-D-manno-heptose-7-phosphate kinase